MINLTKKYDRLQLLYSIINKQGTSVPFKLNRVQKEVCDSEHNRKLILKARQLGMSTYSVLDILDDALFTPNLGCGIVSYSLEHAQHIFKRIIGHALDNFFPPLKGNIGIVSRSTREISFANGSFIRVDTTLRGGTYQRLLLSEFGKTCARSPLKAEEVVAGSLQAVPTDGKVIIESTGEGNEGYFADMCYKAMERGNQNLTPLDYQFFFFPWYQEPEYFLPVTVPYPPELSDYFNKLEVDQKVKINLYQRNWYAQQLGILGDRIKQEFPSTPSESFLSSSDAYYYAECLSKAYKENRILDTDVYDPLYPLYVCMDIGATDLTTMVFFQIVHGERRVVDYYEDTGKGVDFYARFLLDDKQLRISKIFLPHDAGHRDGIVVENTYEREFKKFFTGMNTKFQILNRHDINLGISQAKLALSRTVFVRSKTKKLIDHLFKYRKKWSEATGRYLDEPYHDIHSHAADAFRYMSQAALQIESTGSQNDALKLHKKVVDNRKRII